MGARTRRYSVVLATTLVLLTGCRQGVGGAESDPPDEQTTIELYCSYGATSREQLRACVEHVDLAEVERLDTNAARYARGELDGCRWDAGPYCPGLKR